MRPTDIPSILYYEEACKKNMTFGDVVRYYKPEADEDFCEKVIRAAEEDCMLKYMWPNPKNTVHHIYYVVFNMEPKDVII